MNGFFARLLPYALAFFGSFCIMILELVASRLVARHVGASLSVWTSVIGVILAGICLGNVFGGRLADRYDARKVVGPLFGLGAALTVACLWVNSIVGLTPGLDAMPWELRTVVVVVLDFLIPATVLGMIGPVNAKIAVDESQRAGTAMGDIYSLGALGSILGTFFAGFILMYHAQVSTITALVAAGLAIPAAFLVGGASGAVLGLLCAALLLIGSIFPLMELNGLQPPVKAMTIGLMEINPVALAGHAAAVLLGLVSIARIFKAKLPVEETMAEVSRIEETGPRVKLADLAALSFVASMAFMAFEMNAGRMTQRHMGSSIYGWTSIIGVMLGGLAVGNWLGGKIADRVRRESQVSWLLFFSSLLVLGVLWMESPPALLDGWFQTLAGREPGDGDKSTPVFRTAINWSHFPFTQMPMSWQYRMLFVITLVFFLPAVALGTVSPVVAKLAIDRFRARKRTGAAIGLVYAWGMVGSLLGTFLVGFVLIDVLGTKAVVLAIACLLAIWGTVVGNVFHAAWAGIPIGLLLLASLPSIMPQNPSSQWLADQAVKWGVREEGPAIVPGKENTPEEERKNDIAYVDESDYYYIKVTEDPKSVPGLDGQLEPAKLRTLVLDNLIHGYFVLDHPEHIEYDYEFIYALVAHRMLQTKAQSMGLDPQNDLGKTPLNTMFLGGGAYTFPRYMIYKYPQVTADIAEIDPAVMRANLASLGLREWLEKHPDNPRTILGDARQFVEKNRTGPKKYDLIFGDAFNDFSVPWHLTTKEFNDKLAEMMSDDGVYMINIIDVYRGDAQASVEELRDMAKSDARIFGRDNPQGFPAFQAGKYAEQAVNEFLDEVIGQAREEAEAAIDAQAEAKKEKADSDKVSEARRNAAKSVDAILAVLVRLADESQGFKTLEINSDENKDATKARPPGKLTTLALSAIDVAAKSAARKERQLASKESGAGAENDKDPNVSVSEQAIEQAVARVRTMAQGAILGLLEKAKTHQSQADSIKANGHRRALKEGGFLSAWVETARKTFGDNLYVFGTHSEPGIGLRETFVVVASKKPLKLDALGAQASDPQFQQNDQPYHPVPYGEFEMKELKDRAHGIILTDDYAPVENLLAPTAATRGKEED